MSKAGLKYVADFSTPAGFASTASALTATDASLLCLHGATGTPLRQPALRAPHVAEADEATV